MNLVCKGWIRHGAQDSCSSFTGSLGFASPQLTCMPLASADPLVLGRLIFFLSFPRRQGSHHISAAAKVCCQSTDKAQNTKLQHTRGSNTMSATQTVDALHGPSHHVLTFSAVPSAARRSGQNAPFIYSLASCDVRDSRCPSSPTCLHPRPW